MLGRIKKIIKKIQKKFKKTTPVYIQVPMEKCLCGRTALITGGSSGIGFAMAEEFLKAGASVVIVGRNRKKLEQAYSRLQNQFGGKVYQYVMDCSNVTTFHQDIRNIDELIRGEDNKLSILVNNAGIIGKTHFPNLTEEDFDQVINTNLKGYVFLAQEFAKYMIDNGIRGNILNVGSSSCLRPAISPYTVSKWGVRGLTLGQAKSLAKYGIVVNGIAPGPTATPIINADEDDISDYDIPAERFATASEIASMAVKLVSDSGRMILGDMVYMTGGAGNLTFDDMKY